MVTTTYHSPLGDITLAADAQGLTGLWFVGQSHYGATLTGDERSFDMQKGVFSAVEADSAAHDSPVVADEVIEGCDATSGGNPMRASDPQNTAAVSVLERAWAWLNAYFAGQAPRWTPPLRVEGTEFQHAVWVALLEVPYGQTVARGDLARAVACRCGIAVPGNRDLDVDTSGHVGQGSHSVSSLERALDAAIEDNPIAIIIPCHRVADEGRVLAKNSRSAEVKQALLKIEAAR